MTQEEKQLLLVDLCARLPYGVMVRVTQVPIGLSKDEILCYNRMYSLSESEEYITIMPYLRPMSSMTEEEEKEYNDLYYNAPLRQYNRWRDAKYLEGLHVGWLNAHHFDYRGLIEKGLAISTEEFNPYKD